MPRLKRGSAYFNERIAVTRVADEDGHRHDVGERSAESRKPFFYDSEDLVSLRLEVTRKRISVCVERRRYTREPYRLTALCYDCG